MKDCKYTNICDHFKNKTMFCCRMVNPKLKACAVEVVIKWREIREKEAKNGKAGNSCSSRISERDFD